MKDLEQLVRYLDGELNDTEKQELVEKLRIDPSLNEKIDLINDVDQLVGDKHLNSFEESLKEVESFYKETTGKTRALSLKPYKIMIIRVAAAVLIIVIVSTFFIFKQASSSKDLNKIYAEFYQKMPADFGTRSADDVPTDDFINAIKLYNDNKYKEAIIVFDKIVLLDPTNNAAKLFLGICYTETLQFNNAAKQFKNILENKDILFEEHAAWYLSLCYVKTNSVAQAKPLLNKLVISQSFYMVKASELLKQLNGISR